MFSDLMELTLSLSTPQKSSLTAKLQEILLATLCGPVFQSTSWEMLCLTAVCRNYGPFNPIKLGITLFVTALRMSLYLNSI